MNIISRTAYDQLRKWKDSADRKPLIVLGARQIGKTFVLKQFGAEAFASVHYLNFEEEPRLGSLFEGSLTPHHIIDRLSLFRRTRVDPEKDLLIFDEVGACSNALTSLKYFCEEMPQIAVVAAGSLIGLTLAKTSFPVGKIQRLPLFALSFIEYLGALGEARLRDFLLERPLGEKIEEALHGELWRLFLSYLVVGGTPESVIKFSDLKNDTVRAFSAVREVQKTLELGYLSDIAKHCGKLNAMHIERVLQSIPAQIGRSIDGEVRKYKFKDVLPGKSNFSSLSGPIDWLVKAGMVLQVKIADRAEAPLSAFTAENRFKLYLFDVGMLGALARLDPGQIVSQDFGLFKGFFAENFVAQEIVASGVAGLTSWAQGVAEMEFLLQQQGKIVPVEVKAGRNTKTKSLASYAARYTPESLYVLSGNPPHKGRDGLIHEALYSAFRLVGSA